MKRGDGIDESWKKNQKNQKITQNKRKSNDLVKKGGK